MVLIDGRPGALNVLYRPGNTFTLNLVWPAGALAGRTFTATLDDQALSVTSDGDAALTVVASSTITGAIPAGTVVDWAVLEETGGTPEVILQGEWRASTGPHAATGDTVEITEGNVPVTVTSSAASAPGAGREVDYAVLEANSATFSANVDAFQVEDVKTDAGAIALEITLPDGLTGPVWLELDCSVLASLAGASVALAIAPSTVASPALITSCLQNRRITIPAGGGNQPLTLRARLPAGTPAGSYKIMGGVSGGGTGQIIGANIIPALFTAEEK